MFISYYTLPLAITILLGIVLIGGGIAFAFLKIGGISFPIVIKNFVTFYPSVKLYVWKRKSIPPKIIKTQESEVKKEKKEITISPKITESKLKNLSSKIEGYG